MKNIIIPFLLLFISIQVSAQKEKMISGYWAANYQLSSYGVGVQFKNNIIDKLFVANDIIMLSNDEYQIDKMINLDANLQYVFPVSESKAPLKSYYPLVGIGWANYKTEYFSDFYGELHEDMETPIRGSYIFLNVGIGATFELFDNITGNMEYKWATSHGRIHSTCLLGLGVTF